MPHTRLRKFVAAAGLLLAGFAYAAPVEAVIAIIHDYPIVSMVNGTQTARINAVLLPYIEQGQSCPVTLSLFDGQGHLLGGPDTFELRAGVAAHLDFTGDPNQRVLNRVKVRAQVTIGDPAIFPGCAGGVITSVEIIDTSGWRNLIVHVSGGGAKPRDVELLFDGKAYPTNPTVASARVKPAAAQGGDQLIKEYKSFDETKALSKPGTVR